MTVLVLVSRTGCDDMGMFFKKKIMIE